MQWLYKQLTGVVIAACALTGVPASVSAESVVYSFKGGTDGSVPEGDLINVGGMLYGTTF